MAFNRPLEGTVIVDGRDLASIRLKDYRNQLGVVLQDNFLFDGTIAENIGFGQPTPRASKSSKPVTSRIAKNSSTGLPMAMTRSWVNAA